MLETFVEFTFEAAHQIPPYSGIHGHTFMVTVHLGGEQDPIFGWSHNLYEVEAALDNIKTKLSNVYLNEIDGLEVPSLENVTMWIWNQIETVIPGLQRVTLRRGIQGAGEGCAYSSPLRRQVAP